jgi:hypothetical protein
MALKQICTNPNCGQMWTDATNAASALSITPMPFSLQSLYSKVPAIGTPQAAATARVQPAADALGGPVAPAAMAPASSLAAINCELTWKCAYVHGIVWDSPARMIRAQT